MLNRALKLRIYPNKSQIDILNRTFGCCRFIYNNYLQERKAWYELNKDIPKKDRSEFKRTSDKELKKQFPFLSENTIAEGLHNSIRNCETAFNNFFSSISKKRKGQVGFPKFKSKKQHKDSFHCAMISDKILDWDNKRVFIPKLKSVKFNHHDQKGNWISWYLNAKAKSITVSRNPANEYYVSILFEGEDNYKVRDLSYDFIGLDFSPEKLYYDSNGNNAVNNSGYKPFKQLSYKKLKKLGQCLMRKQKGSSNREKARIKLAKLENHTANQRRDWIEKETLFLAQTNSIIGVEDLNLKGISKFLRNAKNMNDTSWRMFVSKLENKVQRFGHILIKADRYFPSSQICSNCGHQHKSLKLKDRSWICPSCHTEHIRDINAAVNLRNYAEKTVLQTSAGTSEYTCRDKLYG